MLQDHVFSLVCGFGCYDGLNCGNGPLRADTSKCCEDLETDEVT